MENHISIDVEEIIASAIQYLIEGAEFDAAEALLSCNVEGIEVVEVDHFQGTSYGVEVLLRGPRRACDCIQDERGPVRAQIQKAITNALPFAHWLSSLTAKASVFVPDQNWREELHELIKGRGVTNQASGAENPRMWQGFRFRSATEIKIAEALDRANVLFFPLPKARVALLHGHVNIEPDFVVCQEGRWGILEVDGEPFHPPTRSAIEHDRDRQFRRHGVVCVERFDARKCYSQPDKTVEEFLLLMVKTHRRP